MGKLSGLLVLRQPGHSHAAVSFSKHLQALPWPRSFARLWGSSGGSCLEGLIVQWRTQVGVQIIAKPRGEGHNTGTRWGPRRREIQSAGGVRVGVSPTPRG